MGKNDRLIETNEEEGVFTITLDHPPLNILNIKMMKEIKKAFEQASQAKILLLEAKGKVFCAGADVGEHIGEIANEMIESFHGIFRAMERVRGLTIALVKGAAMGGGCELACFCDMVLASEEASFSQPESLVGVFPPVAAVLWPRLMGSKKAVELIISGEKLSASQARKLNLVTKVFPAEDFDEEVRKFLTPFKTRSLVVIEHTKKAVRTGSWGTFGEALERVEDLYLNSLMKSHDAEEGLRAFIEKRKPQWKDN